MMKKNFLLTGIALNFAFLSLPSVSANSLTLENVTKDVTYLASDKMKGRANFSPEIELAATYISKRFEEIGLTTMNNANSFKQSFSIISITPEKLTVKLNGNDIPAKNLAMASTHAELSWNKKIISENKIHTHVIDEKGDMRSTISALNKQGGNHLVLLNTKHAAMFARYQSFFENGLTKLNLTHQGAIVIVLTDDNTIESLSVDATTVSSTKTLSNVVGVLPGKTKPAEIVLYSAHYDHLGEKGDDGDTIFNGADDDASGTSAVINIAQYYAQKNDNARTLIFAAFTAEEIGGFGSRYFSQQLDPNAITAMINIEMIGKPSKFGAGTIWMTGMERSNLGELLNKDLENKGIEIYKDPYPEQGLFYRSDNATLARLGVPAHSFSSTQLDKDQHYHKTSDDLASLDLNSLFKAVETLTIATKSLVDGSVTPSRVDVDKVKGHGLIY